jgi:formylglycine-generating enzyme required for sulfatase activity
MGATPEDPDLPINCVVLRSAREICEALGKRLPTEVEWEWAAGNLEAETTYPWGNDEDICEHAIIARGDLFENESVACRSVTRPIGLQPVREPEPDVTSLGIERMAGSVAEWVDNDFVAYSDPCWDLEFPITEPRCTSSAGTIRGGWFRAWKPVAAVISRLGVLPVVSPDVGIRCAKSL